MSKVFTVACPHCGEEFEVEVPKAKRGALAGLTLEEMTLDQLKREKINANSVLYKAKKNGASEERIAANQERLDNVLAAIAAKKAELKAAEPEEVVEEAAEEETVYAE